MKSIGYAAVGALLAYMFSVVNAEAQVSQCEAALVRSTYNSFAYDRVDYRLALTVDESTYNEIKRNAGGSATIYGVPVGATYDEFQKRAYRMSRTTNESLTHEQALNIRWTGLDPNAPSAYRDCLNAQVFSGAGLHLAVASATQRDISIRLNWVMVGTGTASLAITWSGAGLDIDGKPLPTSLVPGERVLVIPRPANERTIAVNGNGSAHFVVVTPLPTIPPRPQKIKWAPKRPSNDGPGRMVACYTAPPEDELIGTAVCTVPGDPVHTGCWPNDDRKNENAIQMCKDKYGDY
jgi:hypothetical protein